MEIRQTGHEFKFGANLFMLDEFESEEKNRIYREKFPEAFNLATVPFYWNDLEPEEGKPRYAADSPKIYRRPAPDLCVAYCKEKGIGAYQGGTCNETDRSAQVCVQSAMATQPSRSIVCSSQPVITVPFPNSSIGGPSFCSFPILS